MNTRLDPAALRWLVGIELGRYRREAGMSLNDVAAITGLTKPKISHLEAGRTKQNIDDVTTILDACGAKKSTAKTLAAMAERATGKTWWAAWAKAVPTWLQTFLGLEGMATSIFTFEPSIIPALLQTPEYTQQITRSSIIVRPDQVARIAALRHARAARLAEEPIVNYSAIIGESALRLQVGDEGIRVAQLKHLASIAKRSNVSVQVLRSEDGPYTALNNGKFDLLRFANARPVAYNELIDNAVYEHDLDLISTYEIVENNLKDVALPPAKSVAFINELLKETGA